MGGKKNKKISKNPMGKNIMKVNINDTQKCLNNCEPIGEIKVLYLLFLVIKYD